MHEVARSLPLLAALVADALNGRPRGSLVGREGLAVHTCGVRLDPLDILQDVFESQSGVLEGTNRVPLDVVANAGLERSLLHEIDLAAEEIAQHVLQMHHVQQR